MGRTASPSGMADGCEHIWLIGSGGDGANKWGEPP